MGKKTVSLNQSLKNTSGGVSGNLNQPITINFSQQPWVTIHPNSLPSFYLEENRIACMLFPNGILPGAKERNESTQLTRIARFHNYLEFSKIMDDEVEPIGDELYLTTKFYERRQAGWGLETNTKKEGNVIGYCANCFVYNTVDIEEANKIFYATSYYTLTYEKQEFVNLVKLVKGGATLILEDPDDIFINELSKLLHLRAIMS